MNLQTFVTKWTGKSIDYDGVYGAQCVDLIKQYLKDEYGLAPGSWGDAYKYFTNTAPAILAKFDRVTNNPADKNQVPKAGDIIVWSSATPGSNGAGHVAIYLELIPGAGFYSLDQNWGGKTVMRVKHSWTNVIGWLTPKGVDMPIPDQDNYYWRYGQKLARQVRGRELSRDEFRKHLVGKADLTAVEILSDDPEADRTLHAQDVGVVAVRDNWEKQIYDLKAKTDELGKAVTLKDNEIKKLQAELAVQSSDTQLLNGLGEWLKKIIIRLGLSK